MKVLVAIAIVAVLAAGATKWARDKGESLVHHAIDTALPAEVGAHPWAPLSHGRPVRADGVTFHNGSLSTDRCHATLGSYTVWVNHHFSFRPAATPLKASCPGRHLRSTLTHATRVDIESHGSAERLVFTNDQGHRVAQLQGRGN